MNWTVKLSSKAEKYYLRLDTDIRGRIKRELVTLSEHENPLQHAQVKPLVGELRGFCRLRVGPYRVIFSLLKDEHTIAVVNIVPRGEAYR